MNHKITACINTLNEEKNIKACLDSVSWVDEIVVVDMQSDDKTVQIAKEYTDKIFMHKRLGYADPARQFALEKAGNEWIIVIDADELVTLKMKEKILNIVLNDLADVVFFPRTNYCFGKEIKGGGWGPNQNRVLRLFKKSYVSFNDKVHDFTDFDKNARVMHIKDKACSLIHFAYEIPDDLIDKIKGYTTIEAKNIYNAKKQNYTNLGAFFKFTKEFIYRFIFQKGFKDGFNGFVISLLMAVYPVVVKQKVNLIKGGDKTDYQITIKEKYQDIKAQIISELNSKNNS